MNTVVITVMTTLVLTVVYTPDRVSSVPKTEAKRHISLTLTQVELAELDAFALSMGEGTYRNEAVVEAVRRASGLPTGPVTRSPVVRVQPKAAPGERLFVRDTDD